MDAYHTTERFWESEQMTGQNEDMPSLCETATTEEISAAQSMSRLRLPMAGVE